MNVLDIGHKTAPASRTLATPKLSFQREAASKELFAEMEPLLRIHWKEVAHFQDIELNPDYGLYLAIEATNGIRIYTARGAEGQVIGYAAYFVRHNLHYKQSKQAVQDVVFIDPRHRGFGEEFLTWCDEQLRGDGVEIVYHHVKVAHNWGQMLERNGYIHMEHIYAKRIQ